jgi:hypothetical protein
MTWPDPTDAVSRPSISGSSNSPELVADAPVTTWRNSGKKAMAPNIATPMMKLTEVAMVNVRSENRCTGTTGSAARRSTTINTVSRTTDVTMSPMIVAEPQSYCVPPHVVSNTTHVTAAASTTDPA